MIAFQDIREFVRETYSKYPAGSELSIVPYAYTIQFGAIAAAGQASQSLALTANGDFIHTRTSYRVSVAATAQNNGNLPVPLARLLITDSGSNEQFTANAIDLGMFATAQPAAFSEDHPYPRFLGGRSTLTLQLTSYDSQAYATFEVALVGVLVRGY